MIFDYLSLLHCGVDLSDTFIIFKDFWIYIWIFLKKSIPLSSNQWWELYDSKSQRNYYYNGSTGERVWQRPLNGEILPMTKLQVCLNLYIVTFKIIFLSLQVHFCESFGYF